MTLHRSANSSMEQNLSKISLENILPFFPSLVIIDDPNVRDSIKRSTSREHMSAKGFAGVFEDSSGPRSCAAIVGSIER